MHHALKGWADAWQTGFHLAETWAAAAQVIAARTTLIGAAMADPLKGDWPELSRMAPEKLAAFGQAAEAAALDAARLHADSLRMWASLGAMAMTGRPPTLAQAGDMMARVARAQSAAAGAPGRALAPVRRAAMANAKRLRR